MSGKAMEEMRKTTSWIKESIGVDLKWATRRVDRLRIGFNDVFNADTGPAEFLSISIVITMGLLYAYAVLFPWYVRLALGLIGAVYTESVMVGAIALVTCIPKIGWITSPQTRGQRSEGWMFMLGAAAMVVAGSGYVSPQLSVTIMIVAVLIFTAAILNKSANHSVAGANTAIVASMSVLATIILGALIYFGPRYERWWKCGRLAGFEWEYENCVHRYNSWFLREISRPWGDDEYDKPIHSYVNDEWSKVLMHLARVPVIALLAFGPVVSVLGKKYKEEGMVREMVHRNSRTSEVLNHASIVVKATLSDVMTITQHPVVLCQNVVVLFMAYSTPDRALLEFIAIILGFFMAIAWFSLMLSEDFAREGGRATHLIDRLTTRDGIIITGTIYGSELGAKTTAATMSMLALASGCFGTIMYGSIGAAATLIPFIVRSYDKQLIPKYILVLDFLTTIPTKAISLIVGTAGTHILTWKGFSLKSEAVKPESVVSEIPSSNTE